MSGAANQSNKVAGSHTLTPAADQTVKQVPVEVKKAVVFFIGGAADKESYYLQGPNNNVADARRKLDADFEVHKQAGRYVSYHLGYSDVRGGFDIDEYVLKPITTKTLPVYLVGHSLGGWNGAHLSQILVEKGYKVKALVTLDPVGEGMMVWMGSDIYLSKPTPKAEFWINVRADAKKPDSSDGVADFGERWIPQGANVSVVADIHHYDAGRMFSVMMPQGYSPYDYVKRSIQEYLGP